MELSRLIRAAWDARAGLAADPDLDCYRLFHGRGEGCPGLDIDRYGHAVSIAYSPELAGRLGEVVEALDPCRRFEVVVARQRGERPQRGAPAVAAGAPVALRGAPPAGRSLVVREHGLRFAIDLMRSGNPGLYLDARPVRRWIRASAAGRRALNLFAFTGSLGVAAAAGGARSVAHVDSHAGVLDWCRDNAELNRIEVDRRDLARMNIYQHLRRAQAGRQRYGAILLDPPPGPAQPRPKDRTPGLRGTLALIPLVARMLEPDGWLLATFHRDSRERDEIDAEVVDAAGDARLEPIWRGESGPDFPELDPRHGLRVSAWRCARAASSPRASPGATATRATPPSDPDA